MNEQVGMTLQTMLAYISSLEALVAGVALLLVVLLCVFSLHRKRHLLGKLRKSPNYWLEFTRTHLARRELKMRRERLLALKERAAAKIIDWLLYEVSTGGMTREESYDLQKILARNMACPGLMPTYDPDFIKTQIKARRAQGHRPVNLPDSSKRGKFRLLLNSGK